MATTVETSVGLRHPLEPLTVEEIAAAIDILRTERNLGERVRFVSISLHEPPKASVLEFPSNGPVDREAFAILLDNKAGRTYEAVVSLDRRSVVTWNYVANVQPAIMLDEFLECEQACKASPEWQAAMRKRGITNFDLCMVDPWSAGNFGIEAEAGRRLSRALTWVRSRPDDNGYARPVENVITVVDLQAMRVIAVEDYGGERPIVYRAAARAPRSASKSSSSTCRSERHAQRSASPDGWSSRSSLRSATMNTASTGTSTRTEHSNWR